MPVSASSNAEQSARTSRAILGAGLFSNGVWDMLSVLVPLYAVAAGMSPTEIGLIVAARSVLPAALSIHGGILMDRLGTRRVVLWVALATVALPLGYPASSGFMALVALQLLLGLASGVAMAGAQTWSLQVSEGRTDALARFSIASRVGTFIGPVMVGAVWDAFGAWAAFMCVSLLAAGLVACAATPEPVSAGEPRPALEDRASRLRLLADFLPRWSEHVSAFALAAIPAVAFILVIAFLRNGPGGIQASFYVVYLGEVGWSGTLIGFLIGLSEFAGVVGSLMAASVERRVKPHALLIWCIALSIVAITVTPLIALSLAWLMAAAVLRGVAQGVSQPVMYSLLFRSVSREVQGATVGLRNTVTRLASIVTPTVMGVAAGLWGLGSSFYVIGFALLAGCVLVTFPARAIFDAPR